MNCPLCKEKKTFLFHNKVWTVNKGKVYRCNNCDVAFIWPIFSGEKAKEFYKDYNEHVKSRGVTLTTRPGEFHQESKKLARGRYKIIKNYFKEAKSVLEIGSSTGAFLELLKDKQCYGIEPADNNRLYSKKFVKKVYSRISDIPKNKTFDIICMFHVFEHIKNPFNFLQKCKAHLAKGSMVVIESPLIEDPLISLYSCKPFKNFYFQPMHPYIYSLKSLDYVFLKAGFLKKDVIFYQRYGLDNHLTWLSKGKPGGDNHFKDLFGNNFEYKETLKNIKKTDTLFYIAQLK